VKSQTTKQKRRLYLVYTTTKKKSLQKGSVDLKARYSIHGQGRAAIFGTDVPFVTKLLLKIPRKRQIPFLEAIGREVCKF